MATVASVSPIVSDREFNAHILAQLAQGKLTQEQALAQLKTTPVSAGGKLTLKVSQKGGLSVYGLGRWPITLYRKQWERLLTPDMVKSILTEAAKLPYKEG
jgi:hypothetical protein